MLIEFKVANFRSIREEQTLSFIASNYSDELPQNLIELDLPGMKGVRLVKAIALYGANASGKSNVLSALQFLAQFVSDSATGLQPGAPTGTQPFKLDAACLDQPTRFQLMMVVGGVRLLYGLALTRGRVTSEFLVAFPKGKAQVWFERDWNGQSYDWSKSNQYFKHDEALREKTRENASFLSVAAQFGHVQAGDVKFCLEKLVANKRSEARPELALATRTCFNSKRLKPLIEARAAAADLGVVGVRYQTGELKDFAMAVVKSTFRDPVVSERGEKEAEAFLDHIEANQELKNSYLQYMSEVGRANLVHRAGRSAVVLDYDVEESSGTRRFLEVASQILVWGAGGSLVLFDELEASLHPLLVVNLLKNFFSPELDSLECQLIFTTHNPLLLDQTLLRRDQIWFTEKDDEGATRLYPLTDYAPRKDESLVKGYLSGRYGGIPFIPAGLAAGGDVVEKEPAAAPAKPVGTKKAVQKGKKPVAKKLAKKGA